jgi:hypothetical protein
MTRSDLVSPWSLTPQVAAALELLLTTQVAQVYRDARDRRENPTQAVAIRWDAAHSTAAKWVMRARAEGYLEAVDGKDGQR